MKRAQGKMDKEIPEISTEGDTKPLVRKGLEERLQRASHRERVLDFEEAGKETLDSESPFEESRKEKKSRASRWIEGWGIPILIALLVAILIRIFIGGATTVKGDSMKPTLHNGDLLVINKIPAYTNHFRRAEIVILRAPDQSGELYVKRIIGLPGETVEIKDGRVYVDGYLMQEYYVDKLPTGVYRNARWELGQSDYFVMGDNRRQGASNDSRIFGPVNVESFIGVAIFRLLPLSGIGGI